MKRTVSVILLLSALCSLLSGCNVQNSSYLVITPHLDQRAEYTNVDELRVYNYTGLKNAINSLIVEGAEQATIRLVNYTGDVQEDVYSACDEVCYSPLGFYAVAYMSPRSFTNAFTYSEVDIDITYRRTAEQIAAIVQVANSVEYQAALNEAYSGYEESLTAEIKYFFPDQYDIQAMLEEHYYSSPLSCLVLPNYTLNFYSGNDTDRHQIIELTLDYQYNTEVLGYMSAGLADRAEALVREHNTEPPGSVEQIYKLFTTLLENVRYLEGMENDVENDIVRDLSFTAYGALVEGDATSEGCALAFKALCDLSGIESRVVKGRYNGLSHCWNIVRYQDSWYHVDTALSESDPGDEEEEYIQIFMKTDSEMDSGYVWSTSNYPACIGDEIVYPAISVFDEPNE